MITHEFKDRESWLEGRKMGIGASESPALVFCPHYQWSSPYSIWADKCGLNERDGTMTEWQEIGLELEPFIARMYEKKTGTELADPGDFTIYQSSESPFMTATIDRYDPQIDRVVELKNVGGTYAHWSDGVPLHYQVQVQHQMYVCNKQAAAIAVLFGTPSFNFKIYEVQRDDEFISVLVKECRRMWDRVQSGEAPDVDGGPATTGSLQRWRVDEDIEIADLPDEADLWDQKREEVRAKIKELETEKAEYENKIKHAIGGAEIGVCKGVRLYSRKANKRGSRVLRRLLPESEFIKDQQLTLLQEASK
jgi:putative phage-type endonuclease